jgi:hypothetical protein
MIEKIYVLNVDDYENNVYIKGTQKIKICPNTFASLETMDLYQLHWLLYIIFLLYFSHLINDWYFLSIKFLYIIYGM